MTTLLSTPRPTYVPPGRGTGNYPFQSAAGAGIGVLILVGLWTVFAAREPELIFPSPAETFAALTDLAGDGLLASQLATTLSRAATGVLIALVIGSLWGALNGVFRWAASISQPALAALMAVPPIVLVVFGLTWFGPTSATARLVIILVAIPLIVFAVQEAVQNIDTDLLEMGRAFNLSRWHTLRHIVIPAIASPVLAAISVTFGQALRVAVMAELLSATDGIGAHVARARANLETADVFAWTLVLISVVLVIELVLLRPLTNHLLRWRDPNPTHRSQNDHLYTGFRRRQLGEDARTLAAVPYGKASASARRTGTHQ